MSTQDDDLLGQLQQLREGTLPRNKTYHVLHELGRAQVTEAIPDIERFLQHDDPQLRFVALEVLAGHFYLQRHWATAVQALHDDPDDHVRCGAASALLRLKMNTKDAATLRVLAQIVDDAGADESVRDAAWSAMRGVIRFEVQEQRRLARHGVDFSNDIDWELVHHYAGASTEGGDTDR